jgi:hypothetical protein
MTDPARVRELLLANPIVVFNERESESRSAAIATNYTENRSRRYY